MVSAIFFSLCFILLPPSLHTGPAEDMQLYPQKSFWVFYAMELKQIKSFLSPRILCFCFLDFNGFWRENDFTVIEKGKF